MIGPNAPANRPYQSADGHLARRRRRVVLKGATSRRRAACDLPEGVGRSFQHTNVFRKLTVFENVRLPDRAGRYARNFWSRADVLYRDEANAMLASLGSPIKPIPSPTRCRTETKANRTRHRARERSEAPSSTTSQPRNVRHGNARRDRCSSGSSRSASSRCSSPNTT